MSAESKTTANTEHVRALAHARGLERAYALSPEEVAAACERAARSSGPLPPDVASTTEPATAFDPHRFGSRP